jgi:GntR family transcriptional regulator
MGLERSENGIPLYFQLRQHVRLKIEGGEWPSGERIPSEAELTQQFGVSRATVREALTGLVQEGLLERRQGFGTVVRDGKITQDVSRFYTFPSAMLGAGRQPSTEVLSVETVPCEPGVARHLGRRSSEAKVVKVSRLRLADGEPLILESSYLPAELFPELTRGRLEERSLYDVLREDYGIRVVRGRESFEPILIESDEAKRLGVPAHSPGLLVQREAFDAGGRCVEFCSSVVRGDRARYTIELAAPSS